MSNAPYDPAQPHEDLLREVAQLFVRALQGHEIRDSEGKTMAEAVVRAAPTSDPWKVELLRHALLFAYNRDNSVDVLAALRKLGLSTEQQRSQGGLSHYPVLADKSWFPQGLPDTPGPAWFPVELFKRRPKRR